MVSARDRVGLRLSSDRFGGGPGVTAIQTPNEGPLVFIEDEVAVAVRNRAAFVEPISPPPAAGPDRHRDRRSDSGYWSKVDDFLC